ncbi:SDR family NAD(P)-dependent oxidoreductase [Mesorhizobium sp. STM 4661]|uniref:SDR family NAD(P)-dependent oxidoreductase n=1 Tax=Mesorhizobium sp. STM 4661 TaxID=1297570 RepID=UPI0002BEF588|nr:SDR family NAD(P)-dependent oxidoreductase [Mesorhizobium sp. STM 4661]CCV16533.1 putative 3-oxoacyl-(acyl-carrier-protein) reductase [Mesorhizobium sp. STM 4661]
MNISEGSATACKRLAGRRIVVTGAASGIGRATAELFAAEGAAVALLDRNSAAASEVAHAIGGFVAEADVTDERGVEAAVRRCEEALGGIDGIVNAAGIMATGSLLDMPVALWRKIIDVNLIGTYLVTRSALASLRKAESGTVVNIASAQGLLPNAADHTAYAASKGGIVNLSRALAAELAPHIRVNSVCPGMVDTPMADIHRANVSNYALKRIAQPDEIARAILFLTDGDSSYVTGAALAVDGGRSFH